MKFLTRKRMILTLIFLIKHIKSIDLSSVSVKGFCGNPGRPMKSQLSPIQITYSEGETVVYKCDDYISFRQYRKCIKGNFLGLQAVCGKSYYDNDLKFARIFNKQNGNLIREYNTSNLEKFTRFGNSFLAERYAIPLRANGSKSYKIELQMSYKGMFQLVRISLSVVNYLIDERIRETKFNITRVTVSPYRECVLNTHSSVSPWLHNSTRFDYWFSCESKDEKYFYKELKDMSDIVTIETESDNILALDLATFILAQQYTNDENPREPLCGTPEIPIGLESNVIDHQTKYTFKCGHGFRRLDNFGHTHELVCGTDMKWKGSLPLCFPIKTCDHFQLSHKHSIQVYLYENVYYLNNSLWYAIEGTKAYFRCKNEIQILIGKETRVCGKEGEWSDSLPTCFNTQIIQSESKLNLPTIIIIVVITLILTLNLTALLIYCYMKMKRVQSNQLSSPHSNIYADYDHDVVETVNDESYADNRFLKTTYYTQINAMPYEREKKNYDDCIDHHESTDFEDSYVVMKVK